MHIVCYMIRTYIIVIVIPSGKEKKMSFTPSRFFIARPPVGTGINTVSIIVGSEMLRHSHESCFTKQTKEFIFFLLRFSPSFSPNLPPPLPLSLFLPQSC